MMRDAFLLPAVAAVIFALATPSQAQQIAKVTSLESAWPETRLSAADIDFAAVRQFSPRQDVQPLNDPNYLPLSLVKDQFAGLEPVIVVERNGKVRGYPMRIVAAHGVINDTLGGEAIAVSYCKICNSAMVFDREIDGATARIEPTGLTYQDNMVLYDTASESWYQQINGITLAGSRVGDDLVIVPSKITSVAIFRDSYQATPGAALVNLTPLSREPRTAKLNLPVPDSAGLPPGVDPRDRVVIVGNEAYPLDVLRQEKRIEREGTILIYESGRLAAPDGFGRDKGRDVGNVRALQRRTGTAEVAEVQTHVNLAHAFRTFRKDGVIRSPFTDPLDKPLPDDVTPGGGHQR